MTANLKPSHLSRQLLWFLHTLALVAIASTNFSYAYQFFAGIVIIVSAIWYRSDYQQQRLTVIQFDQQLGWSVFRDGRFQSIEIEAATIINRFFILLYYHQTFGDKRSRSFLCFKDSLTSPRYLAFRICLKINGLRKTL